MSDEESGYVWLGAISDPSTKLPSSKNGLDIALPLAHDFIPLKRLANSLQTLNSGQQFLTCSRNAWRNAFNPWLPETDAEIHLLSWNNCDWWFKLRENYNFEVYSSYTWKQPYR